MPYLAATDGELIGFELPFDVVEVERVVLAAEAKAEAEEQREEIVAPRRVVDWDGREKDVPRGGVVVAITRRINAKMNDAAAARPTSAKTHAKRSAI